MPALTQGKPPVSFRSCPWCHWENGKGSAMYALLNDAQFVLMVLSCAAVSPSARSLRALTSVRRAELARLQNKLNKLSERVRALEMVEQRRFLRELNFHSEGAEPSLVPSATKVSAILGSRRAGHGGQACLQSQPIASVRGSCCCSNGSSSRTAAGVAAKP
jgi:hypothetical protein